VVIPKVTTVATQFWSHGDATLLFRLFMLLGNAWFDAIAPYHPTAVGVLSDLGRRPATESRNRLTRNIAIMYASYQVLNSLLPEYTGNWRDMMLSVGLNPNDDQRNTDTAVGIGNMAGDAVVAHSLHDGMNQLGDEGGCMYNCRPYADYTGYKPVNTAYDLIDPSRWQPYVTTSGNGIYRVQQFVTPQYSITQPYSYTDPTAFGVPAPEASNVNNYADYVAQADVVLARSAALTDELKMRAELFDNKFLGYGLAYLFAATSHNLPLNEWVQYYFTVNLAAFDAGIVVWQEKYKYDAVRPYTAIPYIYGNSPVTAWGGPGKGKVNDLPASEWRPYLNVADHPEYPSASGTFAAAIAQASRRFFNSDDYNWTVRFAPGTSEIEPGLTPAAVVVLNFPTWTSYEEAVGQARVDGGVHFPAAIQVAPSIGHPIADLAYDFVQAHINGLPE
jgi:hypothetical protein